MKKIALILSILVIAALAVLVIAVPAQAQDKERGEDEINGTWDSDGYCDFTLTVHQEGTLKWTFYTDNKGYAHFRIVDTNYRQELYAKDNPENVIKLHFQGPQGYDELTLDGSVWIEWIKGQWQRINLPGYGAILGRAGNLAVKVDCSDPESDCIVDVLKDVGLNSYDPEEVQAMCDYLEP